MENYENEPIEPTEDDAYFSDSGPLGSRTSLNIGGKFIGEYRCIEDAEKAYKRWCKANNYTPMLWIVSDHGNISEYQF